MLEWKNSGCGTGFEKSILSRKRDFSTAFKKRKEILKKEKDVVAKEEYLQKLEDEFSDFFDIYGKKDIEQCYEEKMSECNREALESLQYQSYACYMLATIQDDENKKKEWLQKAIRISDKVIIARSIVLGSCHRKTLESMRYGAEYYHQDCQRNEAEKRIRYVLKYLDDKQVSENQVEDYKELFEKVTGEAEGNV